MSALEECDFSALSLGRFIFGKILLVSTEQKTLWATEHCWYSFCRGLRRPQNTAGVPSAEDCVGHRILLASLKQKTVRVTEYCWCPFSRRLWVTEYCWYPFSRRLCGSQNIAGIPSAEDCVGHRILLVFLQQKIVWVTEYCWYFFSRRLCGSQNITGVPSAEDCVGHRILLVPLR
jgi:hypothetical protein